eukprot:9083708-Pyramimonas_sp.AAC.1
MPEWGCWGRCSGRRGRGGAFRFCFSSELGVRSGWSSSGRTMGGRHIQVGLSWGARWARAES